MTILPQGSRLLMELRKMVETAIHIPDGAQRPFPYGVITAIGPDVKRCKVGEAVMFMPSNVIGIELPDGPIFLISEDSVLAVLEDMPVELSIVDPAA